MTTYRNGSEKGSTRFEYWGFSALKCRLGELYNQFNDPGEIPAVVPLHLQAPECNRRPPDSLVSLPSGRMTAPVCFSVAQGF